MRIGFLGICCKRKSVFIGANHLGNVLVTVSDRKLSTDADLNGIVDFYSADVLSATDYYAFGAPMGGRTFNSSEYKYGFQGMLKEDEVTVDGGTYSTDFRMYDARLGRFTSVDPLTAQTPGWTPYRFCFNNPMAYTDPTGLSEGWVVDKDGGTEWKDDINSQADVEAKYGANSGKKYQATIVTEARMEIFLVHCRL